ncbi:extracellular solute-binding protein [[Clostridium] aminophilum]|uniref:extracellular solute-binding protein n=1 Tax=[Clostridium] aminophilum TaxID=1526 RepID=UPI003F990B90
MNVRDMRRGALWKRGIGMVLLAALSVCSAGCASSGKIAANAAQDKTPIKIILWNYYSGQQLDCFNALVQEFNATVGQEKGIRVESTSQGSLEDLEDLLWASVDRKVGSNVVPDLFPVYPDTAKELDDRGILQDMAPFLTESEKKEYVPRYMEDGDLSAKGELKIFPMAKATEVLVLNKTDWDRFAAETGADPKKLATTEGIVSLAEEYYDWTDRKTDEPDDGSAFFGRDSLANYCMVGAAQLGEEILTRGESGRAEIHFDKKAMRKLWDNYYVPFINGYFVASGRFRNDDLKLGTILSFVGSSAGVPFVSGTVTRPDNSTYPIELEILEVPMFEDGERYAVEQGAGMALTASDEAKEKAAVEFLKWFTETENNIRFSLATSYLPVKTEANNPRLLEGSDVPELVHRTLKTAMDTVNTNKMYNNSPMHNSAKLRVHLETALRDQAEIDRESIEELMKQGMRRKEAVARYDTSDNFDRWYEKTKKELEELR